MAEPARHPLVSVLVCVYNGERFLAETIDSVFAQSYPEFELIAVDDGSTDQSAEILRGRNDPRLRVIGQKQQGAPGALDTGLRAAGGAYVCFLDQDDLWLPDMLASHVDLLERHPEFDLSFTWYRVIDEAGRDIGVRSNRFRGALDFAGLLTDFVIGAASNVAVRRPAIERAGGVDSRLPRFYDIDLFLRVALLRPHNVQAIPRDLMLYRRHSSQLSRDLGAMNREWDSLLEKLRFLAPREVASVEKHARSNMSRYFASVAYESDQFQKGLSLLWEGFAHSPARFLTDRRNWLTTAACLSGRVLPRSLHRKLERLAGLRRET